MGLTMEADNQELASNRLAAETFMPIMVEAFHDGLKEVASLSRWLLATLVVINGAGVIAALPLKMASASRSAVRGPSLLGYWRHWGQRCGRCTPSSASVSRQIP